MEKIGRNWIWFWRKWSIKARKNGKGKEFDNDGKLNLKVNIMMEEDGMEKDSI